ncbi:hypothetical protein ACHWQZ_G003160 [Mnemiopsis leidyi]
MVASTTKSKTAMKVKKQSQSNDIQRIGLFSEVGYITIGDPYKSIRDRPFNDNAGKGKQMMSFCTKSKTGLCDGYFQSNFGRIFEQEGYSDQRRLARLERINEAKKNIDSKPFLPSNATKRPSGLGSHYGTFSGKVPYFKATARPKERYKSPGKNFLTNPTKKGSGYGYNSLTIGHDLQYSGESISLPDEIRAAERKEHKKKMISKPFKLNLHNHSLFDPNIFKSTRPLPPVPPKTPDSSPRKRTNPPFKQSSPGKEIGNCKAGTFTPYPEHPVDGFDLRGQKPPGPKYGLFCPSAGNKSRPTGSIINMKVNKTMNVTNFRTIKC